MIWQNPLAWLGIVAIAIPIVLHLRDQHHPRTQRFPTLKFLGAARPLPARRTRLTDLLLLAVRISILAGAVAALAQPLWSTADRRAALDGTLARAIILDTSASMARASATGEGALQIARREAARLAQEVATSVILASAVPARAVAGASAWAQLHAGKREIVIVSDFQAGTIEAADIAAIPSGIGVRLHRIELARDTAFEYPGVRAVVRDSGENAHTEAEWTPALRDGGIGVELLTGAGSADGGRRSEGHTERTRALAARDAATAAGALGGRARRSITIVYPGYELRTSLITGALSARVAWMGDALANIRGDSALAAVARVSRAVDTIVFTDAFAIVARAPNGRPLAAAAQSGSGTAAQLFLFSLADAGSVFSAALIAAASRAVSDMVPAAEFDSGITPDTELRALERPPGVAATAAAGGDRAGPGESDGRWLWLGALVLLVAEWILRRSPRVIRGVERAA